MNVTTAPPPLAAVCGAGFVRRTAHYQLFGRELSGLIFYGSAFYFMRRYYYYEDKSDLEASLTDFRKSLIMTPPGRFYRSSILASFATALSIKGTRNEQLDIEEATKYFKEELSVLPQGHPTRCFIIICLANALTAGDSRDVEVAVAHLKEALLLCPNGHRWRACCLHNLARATFSRYIRLGKVQDLDDAISYNKEELSLLSANQRHDRSNSLSHLTHLLWVRSLRLDGLQDVQDTITYLSEALPLLANGDPWQAYFFERLAWALQGRCRWNHGVASDLEISIMYYKKAQSILPSGHSLRPRILAGLSDALLAQYKRSKVVPGLEDTASTPVFTHLYHPDQLQMLASASKLEFDRYKKEQGLQDAIAFSREALSSLPLESPDRGASLNLLAACLHLKYLDRRSIRNAEDLDSAIAHQAEALILHPPGHPDRSKCFLDLAGFLQTRYADFGETHDIEEAVLLCKAALSLHSVGDPNRAIHSASLARTLFFKYRRLGKLCDLQEGQVYALAAVQDQFHPLWSRLHIMHSWINGPCTQEFRLEIHRLEISLLQQLLVVNPDIAKQEDSLYYMTSRGQLPGRSARSALENGDVQLAIVLSEQCRSMLMSNLQRFRPPVEELRVVEPHLAQRLQLIGSQLESLNLSASRRRIRRGISPASLDSFVLEQQSLIEQWDETLHQIRSLTDFKDFLSTPSFEGFQTAARDGPVIFLNTFDDRSDAIIIFASGPPKLVRFPDVRSDDLLRLHCLLFTSRVQNKQVQRARLRDVTRYLWTHVVSPIVDSLRSESIPLGSRIWWCPAAEFCLLPIHAAGLYGATKDTNLPDLYVSSYTSTISSLLKAKTEASPGTNSKTESMLFVGHSGGTLSKVNAEHEAVKSGSRLKIKALIEENVTPVAVFDELRNHAWVHLSCHGRLILDRPLQSYFQFDLDSGKQRITVQDLLAARLPSAEFAFLSACHSAGSDVVIPDENLHLAGVMQFCGFRSVVGTMWEMYDAEGPEIARDFYKRLMKQGGRYSDAASALHFAIRQSRKRGLGIEKWAMFVHFGA